MHEGKRLGRPPSPPGEARSHRLVTFVNDAEFEEIKALAEEYRISLSRACHHLIRDSLGKLCTGDASDSPGAEASDSEKVSQ